MSGRPLVSVMRDRYAAAMPLSRIMVRWAALAIVFAVACNRSEREPSPAASATPVAPVVVQPPAPSNPIADATAVPGASPSKAEPGTSTACNSEADCRTFSDSCTVCSCRPFAKTSPNPKCAGKGTSCLIDPCTGQRVFCRKGNCTLGDPGDATSIGTTVPVIKDAASTDVLTKGAGSTAPAASTAPKVTDAARD